MKEKSPVSIPCLQRLPKYLRVLKERKKQNEEYISSTAIAEELSLHPVQVRKDLALVSEGKGKPRIGFNTAELIDSIEDFLGMNNSKDVIVVGAGRLGQALMNYSEFENDINIVMAFDTDKGKCDNKKIFHIDRLENLIKRMNIHIAIMTVPKESAQEVCDSLVDYGIKVIWNFAPFHLKAPENIKIKNEDLSASLAVLLNGVNFKEEN